MSGLTGFILILLAIAGTLVPGLIFVVNYKNTNKGLYIAGWCLIGLIATAMTFGLFYFIVISWYSVLWLLILLIPLSVLGGLIATLTIGLNCLVKGFTKGNINKANIITGFVLLGVNNIVFFSIILLILLFTNGFIPISLM